MNWIVAAEARLEAHLREVGDGFGGLCGAGARAAAIRKVYRRVLVTRSAVKV